MDYPGLKNVLEALKTNTYLKVIHFHYLCVVEVLNIRFIDRN